MNVEKSRFAKACVLVIALVAFVPLSGFLGEGERLSHTEASPREASSLGLRDHAFAILTEGEIGQATLPPWFSEEFFFIEGARGYVDEGTGVFALVCEADLDELVKGVVAQLRARGWESGSDDVSAYMSFSREAGQPRSVAISFTEVAGCTTLVLQVLG